MEMASHYYHHINSLEDEANLVKRIINLETEVRAKREKNRLINNSENEKYSKIFNPITQSMKTLQDAVTSSSGKSTNEIQSAKLVSLPEFEELQNIEEKYGEEFDNQPSAPQNVLSEIKQKQRDDGLFGLNWASHRIGKYDFKVRGNKLQVHIDGDQWKTFDIPNKDVWRLLLLQNPANKVKVKNDDGSPTEALEEYRDIVKTLDLVGHAQSMTAQYKKRAKYKDLIRSSVGSGFLYSIHQPSSFTRKRKGNGIQKREIPRIKIKRTFPPSTVVIPSDKQGLLCALVKSMAELNSGNTSMRNLVVPLAQEAKRRGILPKEYSNVTDLNWTYA